MAEYRNDLAWDYLSNLYSASPANATLQDLYHRWMVDNNLSYGDLGGFFTTATGIANAGDAEFEYWKNPPFSPLDLAPALWLDASDATTITASSGAVSEWRDKSGNARHVSQGTAAKQPTTGAATINGLNVLSWPASASNNATLTSSSFAVSDIFIVHQFRSGTETTWVQAYQGLFGVGTTSGGIGIVAPATTSTNVLYNELGYSLGRINGGAEVNLNGYTYLPRPITLVHARKASAVTGVLNVGSDRGVGGGWNGPIAEVVAFSAALSATDRAKIETYLMTKWGI